MSRISYFFHTIFLFYALDIELETGCELFGTRSLPFHLIEILEIVEGKHVSLFLLRAGKFNFVGPVLILMGHIGKEKAFQMQPRTLSIYVVHGGGRSLQKQSSPCH
jgi:hypothetical protein